MDMISATAVATGTPCAFPTSTAEVDSTFSVTVSVMSRVALFVMISFSILCISVLWEEWADFTELIVEYVAVAVLIAEDIASFSDTPPLIRVGMEYAAIFAISLELP